MVALLGMVFTSFLWLQPAEQSMLTTMRLAQLCLEAGFPPGVLNVVTGLGPTVTTIGATLVKHPLVDKVLSLTCFAPRDSLQLLPNSLMMTSNMYNVLVMRGLISLIF